MKPKFIYQLLVLFMAIMLSASNQAQACTATFTASSNTTNGVTFTNTSAGWFYNSTWSFGDGTSSSQTSPFHQYATAGVYSVCLTIWDSTGCQSSFCDSVLVTGNTTVCQASISLQTSASTAYFSAVGAPGSIVTYNWYFGDGTYSTAAAPTHTYATAGTYSGYLMAGFSSGCWDTAYFTAVVTGTGANCTANYSYTQGSNGLVSFTNLSSTGVLYDYVWDFGDGNTSGGYFATHNYTSNGTYYACVTVIDSLNNCWDTYCQYITITNVNSGGGCNAAFTAYDSMGVYYFIPNVASGATYSWNFGDGTTSNLAFPTHVYANPGTYGPCLTIAYQGMTCTNCDTLVVGGTPNCNANFTASVDTLGNVIFTNLSSGLFTNSYWYFGDGNSSTFTSPTHHYATAGTYLVCLTVYNSTGCQASYCDSITIGNGAGPCTPVFYAYPDSTIGNGVVYFGLINNCSSGNWQYIWDFGDSTTATGLYPTHVYNASGWFYVCVTAFDNSGNVLTWCDSVNSNRMGSVGLFEANKKTSVIAFPNPANDQFTVKYNTSSSSQVLVEVYSTEGKSFYSSKFNGTQDVTLNTAEWPAGLYLVQLRNGDQVSSTRISVQH
jgi:PKD repeat protein